MYYKNMVMPLKIRSIREERPRDDRVGRAGCRRKRSSAELLGAAALTCLRETAWIGDHGGRVSVLCGTLAVKAHHQKRVPQVNVEGPEMPPGMQVSSPTFIFL